MNIQVESGEANGTKLPKSWITVSLADCVKILDSQRVPINADEREKRRGDIPYYGATGQVGWIDNYLFDKELVLLGEDGAPFLDKDKPKAYVIRGKSWVNNHAHVLRAIDGITSNSYICHFLNCFDYHGYVNGTTRLKLPQSPMRKIPVPLAPLHEQLRMVNKIEELFSKLESGIVALKKAQTQTKVYRQILINTACIGKLTEIWRTRNTLEPSIVMLRRILQVTEKELELSVEGSVLPKIPDNWSWINLRRIADIRQGVTKGRKFNGKKTVWLPYLRVANVQDGYLDLSEIKTIEALPEDLERYRLLRGDILFNEGGDRDKLGRGCVWNEEVANCIHQNHVFRARLVSGDILPEYLTIFSKSQFARNHFFRYASQTVNLASLNMTNLGKLPIAIPPTLEQKKIVEEVERQLSILDNLESTIKYNLKQAGMLRQSILRTAFGGGLVSQDSGYEPVTLLLQRIQEEKAKQHENNGRKIKSKVQAPEQIRLK